MPSDNNSPILNNASDQSTDGDVPDQKNASDILSNFAAGNLQGLDKVIKFVKEGYKLDNFAMRQLIEALKQDGFSYEKLLNLYMELDKMVEEGKFTNELLEAIQNNPSLIKE